MSILLTAKSGKVKKNGNDAANNEPLTDGDHLALGKNSACKLVLATKLKPPQFLLLRRRKGPAGGLGQIDVYLQQPAAEFSSKQGAPAVTAHFPPNVCLSSSCDAGGQIDQYELLTPEASLKFSAAPFARSAQQMIRPAQSGGVEPAPQ
jgi:hypothetical protein